MPGPHHCRFGRAPKRGCGLIVAAAALMLYSFSALASGTEVLEVAGARIHLQVDSSLRGSQADLREWIVNAATTVAHYYGRFPSSELELRLSARSGGGVQGGTTTNDTGAVIAIPVGVNVTRDELHADWVLVHEMVHLAFPQVSRRHNWLSEGLATYIEGIARAQAGRRDVVDVWEEFTRAMPLGLPRPGEGGLDETHTWARTYWGGALFCLLADVAIREKTKGRFSLRDALAAILHDTGGYASSSHSWRTPLEDILQVGDDATGTTVLMSLYEEMKDTPASPDLKALWARLGVARTGRDVSFDSSAPLATLRDAMTAQREVE